VNKHEIRPQWLQDHVDHDGDECLIWPFGRDDGGYAGPINGQRAYRAMCELANGPAPTPKHWVAHSCGRGQFGCVHPQHVRWATPKENHADKVLHGTDARGERNGQAKLTEDEARAIRNSFEPLSVLALRHGISESTVSLIRNSKLWGHLEAEEEAAIVWRIYSDGVVSFT
jgi:hypothetical protein